MANTRLSDLGNASALSGTDLFYVVQTAGVGGLKATGAQFEEFIEDVAAGAIVGGSNISVTYNDGAGTITIAYTGAPPPASTTDLPEGTNLYFTDERAQDAVGAMVTDGSLVYVDAAPLLTRAALTGDVTAAQGSNATTIANDAVTNAKLANMATSTIKGRVSSGTGDPEDLSSGQVKSLLGVRDTLTAARTYYVRTDGSDSNDGLTNTAGGAFLTIQRALNAVGALDLSIYNATIQVADGTYTEQLNLRALVGAGSALLIGNVASPANVILNTTASGGSIQAGSGVARWFISGFTIDRGGASGQCVRASGAGAEITLNGAMRYGDVGANYQLFAASGASLNVTAGYEIFGGANTHIRVENSARAAYSSGLTITLTGTPAFSGFFADARRLSSIIIFGQTFSGAATGTRYSVTVNALIETNGGGATYLPGNSAGSASSGGQYV